MTFLEKLDVKKIIMVALCVLISVLFFVFAYQAYPVPAGDSIYFLVPAVQFAARAELVSPLYPSDWMMDKVIDPTGARRFLFYPPLFPLVVSALMPWATPQGAFVGVAIINIAVILLSVLLFYKIVTLGGDLSWFKVFLVTLGLFALAASLFEAGRPEVLARLWIVLGALVPFYTSKKYQWVLFGILLGLIFATHPPAGVFSILVLGIYFGATLKFKDIVLWGSKIFLLSFLVSLGSIALGPFGVRETIYGTFRHVIAVNNFVALTGQTQGWFTLPNLFNHYILSPVAPFYGLVIILFLILAVQFSRKHYDRFASPFVMIFCGAALLYIVGKVTYSMGHVFYITLFAPLIFAAFIHSFLGSGLIKKIAI
ncbi:MAG: hypothetical protein AAB884_01885, partial [Patescibacteria group bacterium]